LCSMQDFVPGKGFWDKGNGEAEQLLPEILESQVEQALIEILVQDQEQQQEQEQELDDESMQDIDHAIVLRKVFKDLKEKHAHSRLDGVFGTGASSGSQ
jgi:hypothetical protein